MPLMIGMLAAVHSRQLAPLSEANFPAGQAKHCRNVRVSRLPSASTGPSAAETDLSSDPLSHTEHPVARGPAAYDPSGHSHVYPKLHCVMLTLALYLPMGQSWHAGGAESLSWSQRPGGQFTCGNMNGVGVGDCVG
jgi:hypothetical protein